MVNLSFYRIYFIFIFPGITSKLPSAQDLSDAMPSLVKSTLHSMATAPVVGDLGANVQAYAEATSKSLDDTTGSLEEIYCGLSKQFARIITSKKIVFPNTVKTNILVGTNHWLSLEKNREDLKNNFQVLNEADEEVLNPFVGEFIFMLSRNILLFCLKRMRCVTQEEVEERRKRSADKIDSEEFQQLVYHIGGSIVSGFLWKGKGYSETSSTWAAYCEVLKGNFLRDTGKSNECSEAVRHFTDTRDRGGLTHISDSAFDFFLTLFDCIMQCEGEDGSIPPDVIDKRVLGDDAILCLWDVMVGNELDADQSLDLLIQITQAAVRVVVKGIMKRRLNEHLKQSYSSVALRSKLAS